MAHIEDRRDEGRGWRVRYRDPARRERSKSFKRKIDAERFLIAIEASKMEGRWVDPRLGKTPLQDLAERWLASRLSIRPKTRDRDVSMLRRHVLEAFADVAVDHISKRDVQLWVSELSEEGYSPWTVRKAYQLLSNIMAEAVDQRMIPESPCRRISLPRFQHQERRFLSPDEVERLVAAVHERCGALVYAAVYLRCRWAELAGLKRSQPDLLRRRVRIVGTIERDGGTYRYTEETKTSASRRTIGVPGLLAEILALHLARAPGSEWVFPAPEGGFLRYDNGRPRVWEPAVQRAGLGGLTFHELRHTSAAIMVDQGADPLQVQRRLGHKDIGTALGFYGRLFPKERTCSTSG
jgi:integrase